MSFIFMKDLFYRYNLGSDFISQGKLTFFCEVFPRLHQWRHLWEPKQKDSPFLFNFYKKKFSITDKTQIYRRMTNLYTTGTLAHLGIQQLFKH
jgi:hypothetical protein